MPDIELAIFLFQEMIAAPPLEGQEDLDKMIKEYTYFDFDEPVSPTDSQASDISAFLALDEPEPSICPISSTVDEHLQPPSLIETCLNRSALAPEPALEVSTVADEVSWHTFFRLVLTQVY